MKKKLFSFVMATLIIFMSMPTFIVPAQAATTEDGLPYSISNGKVTITTGYTGNATELEIPATIEGYPVTSIGPWAFYGCNSLISVTIPEGVTVICDSAFAHCSSLTSMILPDSVTTIDVAAFYNCSKLNSITFSENVTTIVDGAFSSCSRLSTVYYGGNERQWGDISIGSGNDPLINAEKVFLGGTDEIVLPEGLEYTVADGAVTITGYTGSETELVIPAIIEEYTVTAIGNSAFACHEDLISIDLPDTVTSIGDSAFMRCFSLESINIPEGVTSIGEYAFLSCSSLKSIDIPDGVTIIGEGMFSTCSSLTSITIPDGVTLIDERAFYGCDNLTSINVPDSVLNIGEDAFTGCYSLESINLLSVTSIGRYAFLGCYDLTSITISASLKTIEDYAFNECENLKTVYYVGTENEWNRISIGTANDCFKNTEIIYLDEPEPEAIPEGLAYEIVDGKVTITGYTGSATELVIPSTIEGYPVTKIGGYAFSTCFSLKSINIPEGVTSIEERAFRRCEKLTSINIPDSVLSIGEHAFTKCYGLESINLSSVTSIDRYAFSWCYALESITISSSFKTFGDNVFIKCEKFKTIYYVGTEDQWDKISIGANNDLITNAEKVFLDVTGEINPNELEYIIVDGEVTIEDYYGKAVDIKIPATIEGYPVTKIDREAFYGCESIKSIELPDTITVIKWYAFFNCKNLESIDLPANLISIDNNVFRNCTNLKSIVIPEGVTCIEERAFENCTSLITVAIPDSVTFIDSTAFGGCASLQMVTIPNKVTSISSNTFSNCRSLKIVNIPDGVTEIGASAFHGCTSLTSINIPASVTSIGDGAFSYCSGLNNVKIPPQITRIGDSVFRSCMFLQNVTLPRGLTEIGEYAFTDCMFLRSIDIPANVTSIGDYAFSHCTSLSNITLCEGLENIGTKAFSDCMSLTALNIPESVTSIGIYAFVNCTGLEEITLPDGLTTGIGEYMFSNCTGLKAITIPEGVTNIDCGAFLECSNLSTVYYKGTEEQWSNILMGDFNAPLSSAEIVFLDESTSDTETGVYKGFTYTVSDGEVTINNYIGNESEIVIPESIAGYPVTKIGCYAFSYNENLMSVEFPASVKRIEYCVLASCSNLETVILPEGIEFIGAAFAGGTAFWDDPENWTDGALYIGEYLIGVYETPLDEEFTVREGTKVVASYAFQLCKELKKINLPEGLITIGDNAFGYCASLESINIPSTVKYIEYGAFRDCTSLANIELPVGIEFLGAYAFHQCTSLTKVTLPEGIKKIESELFLNCTSITEVTMSANIGEIGYDPFLNCTSLSLINFIGTEDEWNALNVSGIGEGVTVRFITEETPDDDIDGDGEENKTYDLSELFTDYEEKSIYEMVEFIDANQATQKWVEFIRADLSDNNTYMIYLHMSGELTNSLGSVPDLSIAGITDSSAKYLLSTARVTNTDPDNLPGNIMIGDVGNKLMTVEINKEFIEHINSLSRLDGNVMILDLLMNILENEEVVGVSFSINAQLYTNTSTTTFNLNSDSTAYEVCVMGDCNGDGIVNGIDGNIMKRILSGSCCKADPFAVDLHDDGILNAKDCLELKRTIVQG